MSTDRTPTTERPHGRPETGHVPGDPRGFAPREAAEHRASDPVMLLDGTTVRDHEFTVPVDHADTLAAAHERDGRGDGVGIGGAGTLTVFAREFSTGEPDKPWLLYLQGGPGSAGSRPARLSGWMKEAAREHRILMLDQRGTGRSTPATVPTLAGMAPAAVAELAVHLRAPSIVADAEMIRRALGSPAWTTLGQSFGGFCTLSYLSWFPEGLERCLVTGGLAPLTGHADRVYDATYARMRARNREFFERCPSAWTAWERIVAHLRERRAQGRPERLHDGTELTVARAQMLGMLLGGNTRVDQLLYLLVDALPASAPEAGLSEAFRAAVAAQADRHGTVLYTLVHEAIYAQPEATRIDEHGRASAATAWSAARVLGRHPDFDPEGEGAPLLTGEHVFDWQLEPGTPLAPLAEAAALLAAREDWGPLYDLPALARSTVPAAAAVYSDDVFVDRDLSLETAGRVGALRVWETDEFHHDGLGDDGPGILTRLLELTRA